MSPPYNDRRRQGVWSHWVPLIVTVTIATAGLAAWAFSQRDNEQGDHEEDHEPGLDYENADYGDNPPYGATSRSHDDNPQKKPRQDGQDVGTTTTAHGGESSQSSWGYRMSGALRRTPSPQQFFDSTGKTITAGVAAAGAVVGKALASIREDDKNPWSEEADAKKDRVVPGGGSGSGKKRRRTVAIVISADTDMTDDIDDSTHEHASILSHIPRNIDHSKVKLFVLIYAPGLSDVATDGNNNTQPPASLSSSFSNIGHDQAFTPGSETRSPLLGASSSNSAYNALYSQALRLVEKETMIIPFTTSNGHSYILRPLQPDIVYLQESLSGESGSIITNLQTWLRNDLMLIVGAEHGSGGLADSESEAERTKKTVAWWQRPERVGRGKGIIVVDSMRVHDDWVRRIEGQE